MEAFAELERGVHTALETYSNVHGGKSTVNAATRTNIATLGTIFGISGICHGFFEVLQGNTPTSGFIISAIGEAQQMWPHG